MRTLFFCIQALFFLVFYHFDKMWLALFFVGVFLFYFTGFYTVSFFSGSLATLFRRPSLQALIQTKESIDIEKMKRNLSFYVALVFFYVGIL